MLTWQRWSHCWVHSKLFTLKRVTSADKADILMWYYSHIFVLTDQQLSLLKLSFPSRPYVFVEGWDSPLITITGVSWWVDLCNGWSQTLPTVSFHLYPPVVFFTLCILHLCLRIFQHWQKVRTSPETSLLHSCSHFHTGSKHGGQLQHLTMLAINHPLNCETQRAMGSIGNTLQCIFSPPLFWYFH